jgi:hypothetical protein
MAFSFLRECFFYMGMHGFLPFVDYLYFKPEAQ